MDLKYLKENISKLDNSFMIFQCDENYFLAKQYIEEISKNKKLNISYIDRLEDLDTSSMSIIFEYSPELHVIITDTFSELLENYYTYTNCIVICKKVDKNILEKVSQFIISFPALKDWQVKEYIHQQCKGLSKDEINWLYTSTQGNIYRIDNETSKIKVLLKADQKNAISNLKNSPDTDLYYFDNFYLSNAILAKNTQNIIDFLYYDKLRSVSPFQLISSLLSEFKLILLVNFGGGKTASQLGISDGKFNYIRRNYNNVNQTTIVKIFNFLSGLDIKIKQGKLDASDTTLCNYILCNVMSLYK